MTVDFATHDRAEESCAAARFEANRQPGAAANEDARPSLRLAARTALALLLFCIVQAAVLALPGRLLIDQFEADVLHLIDGLSRIAAGYRPYLDFSTPLGPLSFLPLSMWGTSLEEAFVRGNILAAAVTLPFAAWLAATRLSMGQALWIGVSAIIVACAMTWSANAEGSSFATHYNRWAWALTIVAVPIVLVPPVRRTGWSDLVDGLALGLIGAILVFLKATYAAALAPLWLVWAVGRPRAALVSAAAGAVAALAIMSVSGGFAGTLAYVHDLMATAASDVRPKPGRGFFQVASHPTFAPVTLAMVVAALTLAKAGLRREALAWGLGLLALIGIAWQNYGNHVTGALLAPPLLLALAPRASRDIRSFGLPAPTLLRVLAVGIGFAMAPSLAGLERSAFNGWTIDEEKQVPLFAEQGAPQLWFEDEHDRVTGTIPMPPNEAMEEDARTFHGVHFPSCRSARGYEATVAAIGRALAANPSTAGRRVLNADLVDPVWWAAGAPPPPTGALWRYGPLGTALDSLDLLAVANCPADLPARNRTLDEISGAGIDMRVVLEIPGWTVFERAAK